MVRTEQYHAYRRAINTVGKSRQIVMLYDGIISSMQQAKSAMLERRIEDRYNLLAKATQIIMGLQGSIDFEAGHEVAATLYDFYSHLLFDMNQLHRSNDAAHCQTLIDEIKGMRNVWAEIDAQDKDNPAVALSGTATMTESSENGQPGEHPGAPPGGLSVSA